MTWPDVTRTILKRWPAGPGNRPWDPALLGGYVEEMQVDGLTPDAAIMGLRASSSDFIPSVGGVRRLAREALGPPSLAEIHAAEQAHRLGVTQDRPRLAAA